MINNQGGGKSTNRIQWIDLAKGYGIIFVIIGHISPPWIISQILYSFHLPLFFFLSGYVFSDKNKTLGSFFIKKIQSILKPYLSIGLLLLLFSYSKMFLEGDRTVTDYVRLFVDFIIQRRLWTLWFLTCLFLVNIFYFLLNEYLTRMQLLIASIILPIIGLAYYNMGGIPLPWNIDVCFIAFPFFFAGDCLSQTSIMDRINNATNSRKTIFLIFFIILNLSSVYVNLKLTGYTIEMYSIQYGNPVLAFISAFAGIISVIIFSLIHNSRMIHYIGRNSLIYFGLHQTIFISLINEIIRNVEILNELEHPLPVLLLKLFFVLSANTLLVSAIKTTGLRKFF